WRYRLHQHLQAAATGQAQVQHGVDADAVAQLLRFFPRDFTLEDTLSQVVLDAAAGQRSAVQAILVHGNQGACRARGGTEGFDDGAKPALLACLQPVAELAHHLLVETVHGGLVKENYKPAIIAETYASTGAAPWRCPGTGSGVVVAVEDVAYQATAHDVGAFEGMHVDTGQAAHTGNGVLKAVGPADVALADVAVDDDTRILADAGEEHLHLRGRGVLRLV